MASVTAKGLTCIFFCSVPCSFGHMFFISHSPNGKFTQKVQSHQGIDQKTRKSNL